MVGYRKLTEPETEKIFGLKGLGKRQPKQLWVRGEFEEKIFGKCAAIVGSRRMSNYGRRVVEILVPRLVEEDYTIVSGFMYGVDLAAHEAAVECGGKTIAVLGWGIEIEIEARDREVMNKIIESGGLVLSEWKDQKPTLWTFPMRNRIVAAISQEVYVVEAAKKSGALITAEMATGLGKKIWAVPGPITSKVSEGTNGMIQRGEAEIWTGLKFEFRNEKFENNEIAKLLTNEELDAGEIARKSGKRVEEVGAELTMMLLKGEVEERGGKYHLVDS